VQTTAGLRSVWLRNVRTGSDTEIVAARAVTYTNLTFSPDGDYLYMLRSDGQTTNLLNLIRQPVLGGAAQLLVRDVDTSVTFSPSGDRIAYARANFPAVGQVSWLVANADGSAEQTLLTRPIAQIYSAAPAWSPDGNRIAYTEVSTPDALGRMSVFDLQTRQSRAVFSSDDIQVYSPVWAADGRALFVQYATRRTAFTQHQIGLVAYPSGQFRTITNDTNDYASPRLSSDRRTLVTLQRRTEDRLELIDAAHLDAAGTEVLVSRAPLTAPRWTRSGELVFGVGNRIVARRPDGGERTIFTTDVNAPPGGLSVCQQSGAVVFHWLFHDPRTVRQLWRVNGDGSGAVQLPEREALGIPVCSPDERWIAYEARSGIMRVPASAGGTPEQLADLIPVSDLTYSPDGRTLVAIALNRVVSENHAARRALALVTPGSPPRLLDVSQDFAGGAVEFLADGVSVSYVVKDGSRETLWAQPLDGRAGGALAQLAPGGHVAAFAWAPDGRSIVLLRRSSDADVVLLTETRR
jgi:Tol biopolymer transport system component